MITDQSRVGIVHEVRHELLLHRKKCDVEPVEMFFKMKTLNEDLPWEQLKGSIEEEVLNIIQ